MRAILKDDDVRVVGNDVPVLVNAGDPQSSAAYRLQDGQIVGIATGNFPKVGGLTYVECSIHFPNFVPDELGGGSNRTVRVYVASAFVLGDVPGVGTPSAAPAGSPAGLGNPTGGATGPAGGPLASPYTGKPDTTPERDSSRKWLIWGLGAVLALAIVGLIIIIARSKSNQ